MSYKNSKNFSYTGQIGLLIGLIGGGLVVAALLSGLIWTSMTGRPLLSMASDMGNARYYYALMVMQLVSTFFLFFVPPYIFARITQSQPMRYLGFKTSINLQQVLLVLGILGLTFVFANTLSDLTRMIPLPESWKLKFDAMETAREAQEKALIDIDSLQKYLLSMLVIALVPGIVEEVFFRGALQNIMTRWFKNPWAAILVAAFIFSAVHMSFYGFFVRFALGIFLGLIFYYSGSLWLAILFHFLFNGVQVTALYLTSHNHEGPVDISEQSTPLWLGLVAFVIIIYAFVRLKKISKTKRETFIYEEPGDPNDFHNWIARNS